MYSTRVARVLAVAVVAAAPLACGAEPASPPPASTLDIAAACAEYVAAYETAASCRDVDVVPPGQAPVPSKQLRARKLFEERCRAWLGAPGSGLTPALLHACSARVRAQCLQPSYPLVFSWDYHRSAFCDFDIPGTLPDGAACGDPTQCAGGGCSGRCGTCVSRAAVGDFCHPHGCAKGGRCAFCKFEGCVGVRCETAPRLRDEGEDCTDGSSCANGLVCGLASTGTCALLGAPGTACTNDENCLFHRCVFGVCDVQASVGGVCSHDQQCRPGLVCNCGTARRCEPSGGRCVPATAPAPAPKLPLGGKCDFGSDCASESRCLNRTCVPLARLGESCRATLDCEDNPFVECIAGTCQLYDPGACSASRRGIADGAPRTIPPGILAPPGRP